MSNLQFGTQSMVCLTLFNKISARIRNKKSICGDYGIKILFFFDFFCGKCYYAKKQHSLQGDNKSLN